MNRILFSIVLIGFSAAGRAFSQGDITVPDRKPPVTVVFRSVQAASDVSLVEGNAALVFGGNTIGVVSRGGAMYTVRLKGIEAPAFKQPFGPESAKKLGYLVQGMDVVVIVSSMTTDGHYIGKVLLDGQDVSLAQIRNGMAWSRDKFDSDMTIEEREIFSQAEQKARSSRIGLWADTQPTPPWALRGEKPTPIETDKPSPKPTVEASNPVTPAPGISLPVETGPETNSERKYTLGPRGGCYYVSESGRKVYVKNKNLCGAQ